MTGESYRSAEQVSNLFDKAAVFVLSVSLVGLNERGTPSGKLVRAMLNVSSQKLTVSY